MELILTSSAGTCSLTSRGWLVRMLLHLAPQNTPHFCLFFSSFSEIFREIILVSVLVLSQYTLFVGITGLLSLFLQREKSYPFFYTVFWYFLTLLVLES